MGKTTKVYLGISLCQTKVELVVSVQRSILLFFLWLNHALLISFSCKESRKILKKKRETTGTKNTNVLFFRPRIHTTATAIKSGLRIYGMSCFFIGIYFIFEKNSPFFLNKGSMVRHLTTNQGMLGSNHGGVTVLLI